MHVLSVCVFDKSARLCAFGYYMLKACNRLVSVFLFVRSMTSSCVYVVFVVIWAGDAGHTGERERHHDVSVDRTT